MGKLVVDIDKILGQLTAYASEAENFKAKTSSFKNHTVSSNVSGVAKTINNYISEISTELTKVSNKAVNYYKKVDNSCSYYQENEDNIESIKGMQGNLDAVDEIIFTRKDITTDFKGAAAKRLSSFASTTIMPCMSEARRFIVADGRAELSDSEVVNQAIMWALQTADNDKYGYSLSMSERWGTPSFDCSTFVMSAYLAAGVNVLNGGSKSNTNYCGSMIKSFTDTGKFKWIPGQPSKEDLKPGDILLNPNSHTEMYIGNGLNAGAHSNKDGAQGDSGGNEVSVGSATYDNYGRGWSGILRYTGDK